MVVGSLLLGGVVLVVGLVQLSPGAEAAAHKYYLLAAGAALICVGLALTALRYVENVTRKHNVWYVTHPHILIEYYIYATQFRKFRTQYTRFINIRISVHVIYHIGIPVESENRGIPLSQINRPLNDVRAIFRRKCALKISTDPPKGCVLHISYWEFVQLKRGRKHFRENDVVDHASGMCSNERRTFRYGDDVWKMALSDL